jgi:hypothetical protein
MIALVLNELALFLSCYFIQESQSFRVNRYVL